ncbi:hypothetical protein [Pelagicoccus mobilis]|uniref:N-acetyltransferase domain-containing protein n=1 Tax=Pelagicoccus mobilis TaxID=415221 RepID=A0A934S7W0_9BACT|nr:hypothetical protein [Pelagicoccus mobilis]MBK1880503.1 hypothetical protein [Pelagicoccus mobilis]
MELADDILDSFARAALESYDYRGLGLDEAVALRALRHEIAEDFGELSEVDVLERRWRNCGIEGTSLEDFSEWLVPIGGERAVICGIRHLGMNLSKPFVQLVPNFQFGSLEEARALYRESLAGLFERLRPKWIQVYSHSGEGSEAGGSLCLVGKAGAMLKAVARGKPQEGRLSLVDAEDESYFLWYEATYDAFHAENPGLKDWVHKNDLELMRACRKDGLLKLVQIDGELAGLVAAERTPFLGNEGIYFVEILLAKKWRGMGLGKGAQLLFVEQCCDPGDFVWGLIDRRNASSLRTALSNGRRVARGECFLEI